MSKSSHYPAKKLHFLGFAPLAADIVIAAVISYEAFGNANQTIVLAIDDGISQFLPFALLAVFIASAITSIVLYRYQETYDSARTFLYLFAGMFLSVFVAVVWLLNDNSVFLGKFW